MLAGAGAVAATQLLAPAVVVGAGALGKFLKFNISTIVFYIFCICQELQD